MKIVIECDEDDIYLNDDQCEAGVVVLTRYQTNLVEVPEVARGTKIKVRELIRALTAFL